ncbi:MAG: hypothetical protein M3O90_03675, partial [Actinomycetota bacterium]|nr:hypothetical protein [Actinomycetota bacterium]
MDGLDTAHVAALLAAGGVALVLLARTRGALLGGFALVAVAEAGLVGAGGKHLSAALVAAGVA